MERHTDKQLISVKMHTLSKEAAKKRKTATKKKKMLEALKKQNRGPKLCEMSAVPVKHRHQQRAAVTID